MKYEDIQKILNDTKVIWSCNHTKDEHEIGCPHKTWTNEDLLEALISKKKFERSGLRGEALTD